MRQMNRRVCMCVYLGDDDRGQERVHINPRQTDGSRSHFALKQKRLGRDSEQTDHLLIGQNKLFNIKTA